MAWPLSVLEENPRYESLSLTVTSAERRLQGRLQGRPIPIHGSYNADP
jgi:hypothetical protein